MSIEVTFTMTRPNASADFWWESTDPSIVRMRQKIDSLAFAHKITRTSGASADGRMYESRFSAPTQEAWNHYMNSVIIEIPNLLEQRNAYLTSVGHSINMVITEVAAGDVIVTTDNPTWKLED